MESYILPLFLALAVCGVAYARKSKVWWLWGILVYANPWVFLPVYGVVLWVATQKKADLAVPAGGPPTIGVKAKPLSNEELAKRAQSIARGIVSLGPAAQGELVTQIGQAWLEAAAPHIKPNARQQAFAHLERTALWLSRGKPEEARGQLERAMAHARAGAKYDAGAAGIELAIKQLIEGPVPARPATGKLERKVEPAPLAAPAADVPAFLASSTPAAKPPASSPPPAGAEAPAAIAPAAEPPAAPPRDAARLPLSAADAAPFRTAALGDLNTHVTALAKAWLAAAAETEAHPMALSSARVKLESAASAVFRGDLVRACEQVELAAAQIPADFPPANALRAGLRLAREERLAPA